MGGQTNAECGKRRREQCLRRIVGLMLLGETGF